MTLSPPPEPRMLLFLRTLPAQMDNQETLPTAVPEIQEKTCSICRQGRASISQSFKERRWASRSNPVGRDMSTFWDLPQGTRVSPNTDITIPHPSLPSAIWQLIDLGGGDGGVTSKAFAFDMKTLVIVFTAIVTLGDTERPSFLSFCRFLPLWTSLIVLLSYPVPSYVLYQNR